MNIQYILIVLLFLLIVFTYIIEYKRGFWELFNLFLRPKNFATLSAKEAMERECKSNIGFKERCEKDENWKIEQLKGFKEQFFESAQQLRSRIYFAFLTVALTLLCASGIAYIAADLISISSSTLSIVQTASAFLILWAIVGKLGYPIQTMGGESVPEIMDKFWFIILNIVGIFFLFFTQFYSFFKK